MRKAGKDGIKVFDHPGAVKLDEAQINDALILSDCLDLNELSCVELLLAAEHQLPNFPGELVSNSLIVF